MATPVETFTTTTLGAPWTTTGTPVPTIVGGRLYNPVNTTYSGINTGTNRYSLVGSNQAIELVRAPNQGSGTTQAFFSLYSDPAPATKAGIEIGVTNGVLGATRWNAGSPTSLATTTYSRTAHRWLRMREASGTIYWEAGPDGASWPTTVHSMASGSVTGVTFTSMQVSIGAGFYGTEPDPGIALWDNLNTVPSEPAGSIDVGVSTLDADLDEFATDAGHTPSIIQTYWAWSESTVFPVTNADMAYARGATWALTWEPWNWITGGATQSTYTLFSIINGTHDSLITTFANAVKAWGHPMILRFAHEMDGNWYPWAEAANGNTPGQYAAAWRHVHDIFTAQGVSNVQWLWCPNVPGHSTALAGLYPGDAYVDLIGIDGYNWGTVSGHTWQTFEQVFGDGIAELLAIAPGKPLHLCELASTETAGDKAAWITDMWTQLLHRTEIRGLWWYHFNQVTDWRIISSTAARTAFAAGVANNRYASGAPAAPAGPGSRINLSPNPALKTTTLGNATDWTSSPSGYARQTGVSGMDRTTGFGGTGAKDVVTSPRFAAVAGQSYVVSVQAKTGASNTFKMLINWYAGTSSGTFISNSGTSVSFTVNGTSRCEIGPYTAPAGAGAGYLRIIEVDNTTATFTALIAEQTGSTGRTYFDGDTTGATWQGVSGNSTSMLLTATDTAHWADTGTKTVSAVGPVGHDTATLTAVGSVVASSSVTDPATWSDAGLIIGLLYDARHGRNRITARGLPDTAIRATVEVKPEGKARWTAVRGGKVGVSAGAFTRSVDDYEFAAGLANTYRIKALSTPEETTDVVVAQATATLAASNPGTWLKFITQPSLNTQVQLIGWGEISRASRTALYDVLGRSDPIAVTDVASSRRVSVQLRTNGVTATDRLDAALSQGAPLFLHTPVGVALPSLYAVAGDYSYNRGAQTSQTMFWTVPLTEVAAPAATIAGPVVTCESILDTYATCDEVLETFDTCLELAS